MKIYDNPKFFKAYSQMERSKYGLSSAGEWYQMKKLFPSISNAWWDAQTYDAISERAEGIKTNVSKNILKDFGRLFLYDVDFVVYIWLKLIC